MNEEEKKRVVPLTESLKEVVTGDVATCDSAGELRQANFSQQDISTGDLSNGGAESGPDYTTDVLNT